MKATSFVLFLFLLVPFAVGCDSEAPTNVAENADADKLAEYEAELAKATSQEIETEDE